MLFKTITIGDKQIKFRASALLPRLYRFKFGRDILKDMRQLEKAYIKALKEAGKTKEDLESLTEEERNDISIDIMDIELFENVAYIMARHGEPEDMPNSVEEWLENFDGMFSIYQYLPDILELWLANQLTTEKPKKK